ncbi:DUF3027 domain-containing protein [Nocardia sp. NPDC051929]|uniref:DUF3027 domain-containing protein n=1 Tax=Nocardia sp. NPDC051929 TaxID=3364327 RepID=UPI0037C91A62
MSAVSVSESGVRPILADAVDLARRALLELEPSAVGAHLGVIAEDESAATHRFEATLPGYRGWQWAVVVAAPPDADHATVSESALLPGPDALVAPEFVPWEQRVRPGDLAPGDLLAPPADDPRLVPGYVATGDPVVDEVAYEVGLGRTKVMSREGREEAAERWYTEHGPDSEMAKAAPATCGTCGFYLPLAGSLRAAFGVCGNAMGADGRVVHVAYGCGAHSDTEVPAGNGSPLFEAYDDAAIEVISLETADSRVAPQGADEAPTTEDIDPHGAAAENVAVAADPGVAEGAAVAGDAAVAAAPAEDVSTGEGAAVVEKAVDVRAPAVSGEAAIAPEDRSETTATTGDPAFRQDAALGERAAVIEETAAIGHEEVAENAAVTENPVVARDAVFAQDDAAAIAAGGEHSGIAEALAAVEGDEATEDTAASEESTTVEGSGATAQPAGSTAATHRDVVEFVEVSAAEVGEIDAAAAFTESSIPPAVRATPSVDDAAEAPTGHEPASAGTVADEPSVATDDAATGPALGTDEAADAGESGSDVTPADTENADAATRPAVATDREAGAAESESGTTGSRAPGVTSGDASPGSDDRYAVDARATEPDAVESSEAAGSSDATTEAVESTPVQSVAADPNVAEASDAVSQAHEPASSSQADTPGAPEPTATPVADDADARSESGIADAPGSEARPEFWSSPRN